MSPTRLVLAVTLAGLLAPAAAAQPTATPPVVAVLWDAAFAAIGPTRPVGLVVLEDHAFFQSRSEVTPRPHLTDPLGRERPGLRSGSALLAYGPSQVSERAGALVRILRGDRPRDLPVERSLRTTSSS